MNINATAIQQPVPLIASSAAAEAPTPAGNPPSAGKAEADRNKAGGSEGEVRQAVEQLNRYIQTVQRNLQFSVDQDSGATVVKVIDAKTDTVIRQIPSEESLKLARQLVEDKNDAPLHIFSSRA